MDKYETWKECIRILLMDEEGKQIQYERENEYKTSIECGYEYLSLKNDSTKINLYQTSKYIRLFNSKTYEVIKREFMPCRPVTLYLYLKEI